VQTTAYTLVIGDKNYSSWSMRPWLLLRHFAIPFEEVRIGLRRPDTRMAILTHSPSGKVPALKTPDGVICESLAIAEYLADAHPEAGLWPRDRAARARARSVACEMHAGFGQLRELMPMDCAGRLDAPALDDALVRDITRVTAIWADCRRNAPGGAFLFGTFGIADAMYGPVATRFQTYGVSLAEFGDDGRAADYCAALLDLPAMKDWFADAAAEEAARPEPFGQ
jgi:glutathione S-transferase